MSSDRRPQQSSFLLLRQDADLHFRLSFPFLFFKEMDPAPPTTCFESLALGKKGDPYSESDQPDLCGRFSLRPDGYVRVDSESMAKFSSSKKKAAWPTRLNTLQRLSFKKPEGYLPPETLVGCLFHLKQANSRQAPQNISVSSRQALPP